MQLKWWPVSHGAVSSLRLGGFLTQLYQNQLCKQFQQANAHSPMEAQPLAMSSLSQLTIGNHIRSCEPWKRNTKQDRHKMSRNYGTMFFYRFIKSDTKPELCWASCPNKLGGSVQVKDTWPDRFG